MGAATGQTSLPKSSETLLLSPLLLLPGRLLRENPAEHLRGFPIPYLLSSAAAAHCILPSHWSSFSLAPDTGMGQFSQPTGLPYATCLWPQGMGQKIGSPWSDVKRTHIPLFPTTPCIAVPSRDFSRVSGLLRTLNLCYPVSAEQVTSNDVTSPFTLCFDHHAPLLPTDTGSVVGASLTNSCCLFCPKHP